MKLYTERLCLIPLNYQQLLNYLKLDFSLEQELNIAFKERTIAPKLAEAFTNRILLTVNNPDKNYLFSTLWAIIKKDENVMVGELCFKGEPTIEGHLEIGYETYPEFQNNGIMTEALKAITKWALNQLNVTTIIAKTDKTNIASQKALIKNNFIKVNENEMIEWQLNRIIQP